MIVAITPDTKLVTITIGANTHRLGDMVLQCYLKAEEGKSPASAPCTDHYLRTPAGQEGLRDNADRIHEQRALLMDDLKAKLAEEDAQEAQVYFVGYPRSSRPSMPLPNQVGGAEENLLKTAWITPHDVESLAMIAQTSNGQIQEAVQAADDPHFHFVDTYTPSIGHDGCAPLDTKWMSGAGESRPGAGR